MKTLSGACVTMAICLSAPCGRVLAADKTAREALAKIARRLRVPGTTVPRLKRPPKLDKAPEVAGWSEPLTLTWDDDRSVKGPPIKTIGHLACDGKRFYAAIRCLDPDMASVSAPKVPRDGKVWQGDSTQILILPGPTHIANYHLFVINAANSFYDADHASQEHWDSGADTHVFKDKEGWTVVLSMPLAGLGLERAPAGDARIKGWITPPLWRVRSPIAATPTSPAW